jgi:hypothetical protein
MSTIESNNIATNSKGQSSIINSTVLSIYHPSNTQSQTPPPPPLPLTSSASLPSPAPFNEDKPTEKFYKKEKQISLEFDQIVKGTYL